MLDSSVTPYRENESAKCVPYPRFCYSYVAIEDRSVWSHTSTCASDKQFWPYITDNSINTYNNSKKSEDMS